MNRAPRVSVMVLLIAGPMALGSALSSEPEVPSFARELPAVRAGEPIFRFNGKNLDGFYPFLRGRGLSDPRGVFSVRDGIIRVSGEEFGGLATVDAFRDYRLIVEWKWGEQTWVPRKSAARDSGVLVHCVGKDGAAGGNWLEGQECQIIEGGTGDLLMVGGAGKPSLTSEVRIGPDGQPYYEKGGRSITRDAGRFNWWGRDPKWTDTLGFRGDRDVEKPAGQWNRMEVTCDGGTITVVLNGYVVNVGTKSSHTRGKIQFQSEGAEIFFRTIEVRPLVR